MAIATSRPAIAASTCSRPLPTTTTRLSAPKASTRSSKWSSSGRLAIGWSTLWVSERMRVPCPAARITTAKRRCSLIAASNGMAFWRAPEATRRLPVGVRLVADEPDLADLLALDQREHAVDHFVTRFRIGAEMELGHRTHPLGSRQLVAQLRFRQGHTVPIDYPAAGDHHLVADRIGRRASGARFRQVELHRMALDRDS